jgi:hypothetical protein
MINAYKIFVEKPEGKRLGDVGTDSRIILKYIFKKQDLNMWAEPTRLRTIQSQSVVDTVMKLLGP